MSHSASSKITSKSSNGHSQKKEEFTSSDDEDDEPIRAPIQLKIEGGQRCTELD